MSAVREAIVLPLVFLSVALFGGLRIGADVRLVPPALSALVLAMLLLGSLARARVLVPNVLMNAGRSPLENVSGAIVLITLFSASAQIFNLLTPERGLLHALFTIFFLVQLLTTLTAVRERTAMLRSLLVLLGSAFVLRFIVLESLYAPGGGLLNRMMTAALEGVTLGSFDYDPNAAATGYIGFATLVLYFTGLILLAPRPASAIERASPLSRLPEVTHSAFFGFCVVLCSSVALVSLAGCARGEGNEQGSPSSPPAASSPDKTTVTEAARMAALQGARVWRRPATPIAQANLKDNTAGADGFALDSEVSCRLVLEPVGGMTPKFNCELAPKDVVKVKYGETNPELYAEVAATRLLDVLGFGADRMYLVRKVRCAGCPPFPFPALKCLAETGLGKTCFAGGLDYNRHTEVAPAVIERRFAGDRIEATKDQGWAWYELEKIDPARGGSSLAEVDAFRLLAVVLSHWDNKAENQRLVCLPGARRDDGTCASSFALMQDLGGTFGPDKVDLRNWRERPVWADRATCAVSMKSLPFAGATFPDRRISEGGRRLLLGLLEQLTEQQLVDLFTGSGVITYNHVNAAGRDPRAWAAAFLDKVRQIREGGPCQDA
jgi:hypothetical protein